MRTALGVTYSGRIIMEPNYLPFTNVLDYVDLDNNSSTGKRKALYGKTLISLLYSYKSY